MLQISIESTMLATYELNQWNEQLSSSMPQQALDQLEQGSVLFFPKLAFQLQPNETFFLSPDHADPHSKNISYFAKNQRLWGVQRLTDDQHMQLTMMLDRFSRYATTLVRSLFPGYADHLTIARTSFRPVQVSDRKTSPRKDDKRLHVDAFPSAPNQGQRILRVFSNINPHGEDRVWRIGEPFHQVAERFIPAIGAPMPGKAALLRLLKITKSYRTLYDHYMLEMHDRMKADDKYQSQVSQQEVRFPTNSSWIVQTDQVSHAAMKGQYLLEQTFYLPVNAMADESRSPLRVLERLMGRELV
jgi:hypothetical protein